MNYQRFQRHFLSFAIMGLLLFSDTAFAWQIKLTGVDGNLTVGETYTMTVEFEGAPTDSLDNLIYAIEWNTGLLYLNDFVSVTAYDRSPGFPDPDYTLWGPGFVSPIPDTDNGRYYEVNAETNIDHMGEFFPIETGETLMATFTFTALASGDYEDLATFYFTPENNLTELVAINGSSYSAENGDLVSTKENSSSILRPLNYILSDIEDQNTNIDTTTNPIAFTITPTASGSVNLTGASSDMAVVPASGIVFYSDDQGTLLTGSLEVTVNEPVTLYLTATPAGGQPGIATITVTASDAGDPGKTASSDFDLTVALTGAYLNPLGADPVYKNTSPITLAGTKSRGSALWLQDGAASDVEMVGTDVDGEWSYEWYVSDGTYALSLINRAGDVEETFAEATLIVDTVPPEVAITRYYLQSVGLPSNYYYDGQHVVEILAEAPEGVDSVGYKYCIDDTYKSVATDYGQIDDSLTRYVVNDEVHQAFVFGVDAAGNEQGGDGCGIDTAPLRWFLEADIIQIADFRARRVQPEGQAAYVQIRWKVDPGADIEDDSLRLWARSMGDDTYEEVTGTIVHEADINRYRLDDTAATILRSYALTDATGSQILVNFQTLAAGEAPIVPDIPSDPDDPDPVDPGDGGGGGGCFVNSLAVMDR